MKPSQYIRKGWCQRVSAKDDMGRACAPNSTYAAKWCLVGAMMAVYPEHSKYRDEMTSKIIDKLGFLGFVKWNDDPKRTQAEVIALLESIGE